MSGTPIQNNLRELWSLFDFVFPGRLGTLPAFEQEFADPIRKGGYSNASPMQVQLAYRCALVLRDLINPYLLRRQKKDVKEVSRMPGKTEHVLFCRLSRRQRALYEAYIKSDDVVRVLKGASQLFAAITVLRKICNHPDLVCAPDEASFQSFVNNGYSGEVHVDEDSNDDDDDAPVDVNESFVSRSGKLEVLAKILPLWRQQGHRVLIFCQWKKMLNIIQRFTELQGWKFGRLDGNTNVASRQNLVDTFNSDDSYFGMLCTTRTGGVGLNLTGANRIILYDPDWNPQTDAQARERAWRFGQEREVTVYRLITAGTIEEKIYHRQIFKTALTNKVLQDPRQRRLFTQKDLRDFFTLKADGGSVASGSDGITDTSEITKGGFVDPDDAIAANGSLQDNEETLRTVMKSKGLAGIFDHDFVEANHTKKSTTEREIEEQAKRVAKSAVSALRKSVFSQDDFVPTWTGSGETRPQLLALAARKSNGRPDRLSPPTTFGKGESVGVVNNGSRSGQSSTSLLASLRQKTNESTDANIKPDHAQYVDLLRKISLFVQQNSPTTDEILQKFDYIESGEAAIFRKLLNSVAEVNEGRWQLQDG
jgi:DNA excision repair protein ERCC-6